MTKAIQATLDRAPRIESRGAERVVILSVRVSDSEGGDPSAPSPERCHVVVHGPMADIAEKYLAEDRVIHIRGRLQAVATQVHGWPDCSEEIVLKDPDHVLLLL